MRGGGGVVVEDLGDSLGKEFVEPERSSVGRAIDCSVYLLCRSMDSEINWSPVRFWSLGCFIMLVRCRCCLLAVFDRGGVCLWLLSVRASHHSCASHIASSTMCAAG